jgi:hypothetical protein
MRAIQERVRNLSNWRKKAGVSLQAFDVTSRKSVEGLVSGLAGRPIDVLILNSAIFTRDGNKIGEINFEG